MCGIAGLIDRDAEARTSAMLQAIEHRGRDDEGVWTSASIDEQGQRVCFGHRRLSIIDTSSAGHQPMISHDRFVVILNGEIYNYRELRDELTAKGHQFRTHADTEVLLHAWAEWETACLDRLNGMFAFALWDDRERSLYLVRDRVGIKPLYYACGPDARAPWLAFASEIKSILASGLIKAELDHQSLHQFLTFLWAPDPNTLFKSIKTVRPGHFVKVSDGQLAEHQWWDISFDEIEEDKAETWWQDRVLETLDRVVKLEMVADVPLGSFLSGGVDSSSIVAMMKQHSNGRPVGTYAIGIEAEDLRYDIIPDDVQWARRVNQQLETDYHEIMLKPGVADLLPKLVYHMDEPAIDMAIPSYLVSRAARESMRVMLSGMGGDEVFAGYPRQLAMKLAGAFDPVPQLLRRPLMKTVAAVLPGGMPGKLTASLRNAKKFARSAALGFQERYLGFETYFTDEMKSQLYTDELRASTRGLDAYAAHRDYFTRAQNAAPLGVQATVTGVPQPVDGKVAFVDNAVDTTTGTVKVRASFGNPEHLLWPGQLVTVNLTLGVDRNAVVVPDRVVQNGPDGTYVFVVKSDQHAEQRKVDVKRMIDNQAVIGKGLSAGETVVLDGQSRVENGAALKVTEDGNSGKVADETKAPGGALP